MTHRWYSADDQQSYGGYSERQPPHPQAPRLRPEDFMALPPTPDGSNPPSFEHYGSAMPPPSNLARNVPQAMVRNASSASWQEHPRNANREVSGRANSNSRGSARSLGYDEGQLYNRGTLGSTQSPRRGSSVNDCLDGRVHTSRYGGTGSELRAEQSLKPSIAPPGLTTSSSLNIGQQQLYQNTSSHQRNLRDEKRQHQHQRDNQQQRGQPQPLLPPFAQSHPHVPHPSGVPHLKAEAHIRPGQVKADDRASAKPLDLTSLWANEHGDINTFRNGYDNANIDKDRSPDVYGGSNLSCLLMDHSSEVDARAADLQELAAVDRKLEQLMTAANDATVAGSGDNRISNHPTGDGDRSYSGNRDKGSSTDINSWRTAAEVASLIDALRCGQNIMDVNNDSAYNDRRFSPNAANGGGPQHGNYRLDSSCSIEAVGGDGEDGSHYGYYTQNTSTHNISSSEGNVDGGDSGGSDSDGSNYHHTSNVGPTIVGRNPAVEAGTRRLGALLREARREALAVGLLVRQAAQVEAQQTLSQLVSATRTAGPLAVVALLRAYPGSEAVQEAGWRAAGDLAAGTAPYNPPRTPSSSSSSTHHLPNESSEPALPPLPPNVVIGLQGAPPSGMLATSEAAAGATSRGATGTVGSVSIASSKDSARGDHQSSCNLKSSRGSGSSSNNNSSGSSSSEGSTGNQLGALAAPARAAAAALGDAGACDLVVSTMQRHAGHAAIQAQCCRLLYLLAWGLPQNHARLGACGACAALVQCLRNFAESRDVMGFGALAVAHLAWHPAARDTLLGMGCCATLETAALAHGDDPEGLAQVIAKAQGELVENERCAVM